MTQTKLHNKIKPVNPDTSCKHMILRNIAEQITYLEEDLVKTKQWVSDYWELSNPSNDPEDVFSSLNCYKDMKRDIQKQLRNLRYIQKVIKLFPDNELTLSSAKDYSESLSMWKTIADERKPKKPDSRKIN